MSFNGTHITEGLSQGQIEVIALDTSTATVSAASTAANIGDSITIGMEGNATATTPTGAGGLVDAVPLAGTFTLSTETTATNFNFLAGGIIQDVNSVDGEVQVYVSITGTKVGGGSNDYRFYVARGNADPLKQGDIVTFPSQKRAFDGGGSGNVSLMLPLDSYNSAYFQIWMANLSGSAGFTAEDVIFTVTRTKVL